LGDEFTIQTSGYYPVRLTYPVESVNVPYTNYDFYEIPVFQGKTVVGTISLARYEDADGEIATGSGLRYGYDSISELIEKYPGSDLVIMYGNTSKVVVAPDNSFYQFDGYDNVRAINDSTLYEAYKTTDNVLRILPANNPENEAIGLFRNVNISKYSDNVINLLLFSDKHVYKTTDCIQTQALLAFVDENVGIEAEFGDPFMTVIISNSKGFVIEGTINFASSSAVLGRGKSYGFVFQKNSILEIGDADTEFIESFNNNDKLFLPEGEYIVTIIEAFSSLEDLTEKLKEIICELKFSVIDVSPH
jgi:hypothetical protein